MTTSPIPSTIGPLTALAIDSERHAVTTNYHPLPVVLIEGDGAWVTDVDGVRYLDALSGYSAVNFGHSNPRIVAAAQEQMAKLGLIARAFHSANLGPFCNALADLTGMEMVLPVNSGAEAVEAAIKAARKWGYTVKGVPDNQAEIIVMDDNFHGRTSTIISFSSDPDAKDGYGPYTPGFISVPFGDAEAVREAITPNTVAVLTEPIQGEAGVIIPPATFLPDVREICDDNGILMIVDEIQSGFGRTGSTFACEQLGVQPDLYTLGKALGGGVYPVSAVVGRRDVLGVFTPGTHGSTFGGNPIAAAIGLEVIEITKTGEFQQNALVRGEQMRYRIQGMMAKHRGLFEGFRQIGMWVGVDFNPDVLTGREVCELMMTHRVLMKDAHGSVVRISPPLCATEADIDFLCDALEATLEQIESRS